MNKTSHAHFQAYAQSPNQRTSSNLGKVRKMGGKFFPTQFYSEPEAVGSTLANHFTIKSNNFTLKFLIYKEQQESRISSFHTRDHHDYSNRLQSVSWWLPYQVIIHFRVHLMRYFYHQRGSSTSLNRLISIQWIVFGINFPILLEHCDETCNPEIRQNSSPANSVVKE